MRLALDDVVDLEDLRLARSVYPGLAHGWHEVFEERLPLFAGIPDLADPEVTRGAKGDVVVKTVRRPVAGLGQAAGDLVVLFGGSSSWREPQNDAHGRSSKVGGPDPNA